MGKKRSLLSIERPTPEGSEARRTAARGSLADKRRCQVEVNSHRSTDPRVRGTPPAGSGFSGKGRYGTRRSGHPCSGLFAPQRPRPRRRPRTEVYLSAGNHGQPAGPLRVIEAASRKRPARHHHLFLCPSDETRPAFSSGTGKTPPGWSLNRGYHRFRAVEIRRTTASGRWRPHDRTYSRTSVSSSTRIGRPSGLLPLTSFNIRANERSPRRFTSCSGRPSAFLSRSKNRGTDPTARSARDRVDPARKDRARKVPGEAARGRYFLQTGPRRT